VGAKRTCTPKAYRLIEAKVADEEIVTQPVEHHAQVINLMDASVKAWQSCVLLARA
jgi:hypothetical protein